MFFFFFFAHIVGCVGANGNGEINYATFIVRYCERYNIIATLHKLIKVNNYYFNI